MSPADIAVIAILVISAFVALFRGFVREVLSIAAWIGAAWLAVVLFARVQPFAREHIGNELVADVAAGAVLFVGLLVLFAVLGNLIAKLIQGSALSAIDRSLGFVFGLLRGAVLVSLIFLILVWLYPADQEPGWMNEARSRPWVERGALALYSLIPEAALADVVAPVRQGIRERLGSGGLPALEELSRPQPGGDDAGAAPESPAGEQLERLIESTGGDGQ